MKTSEIFKNKVDEVKVMFPSLFTKEDVIAILSELEDVIEKNEQKTSKPYDRNKLINKLKEALEESISSAIDDMSDDEFVETSEFEFSIGYGNRIEVDDVNVKKSDISDSVCSPISQTLNEVFDEFEAELEEQEEEEQEEEEQEEA